MLSQAHSVKDVSQRSLQSERKLWHDPGNTPSLGCLRCPDRATCGGLQVSAAIFDCLAHCCNRPQDCDAVCRNNPDFVDRIREISGFDLASVPRAKLLPEPILPTVVPMLYHGAQREGPFSTEAVCLPLFKVLNPYMSSVRFESHDELCDKMKISPNATIVLSGTAIDQPLERWWGLGNKRRTIIHAMRHLRVALVTTPNYSLFTDQPRWNDLHSMKRIALIWQEFIDEGLPAALHVNARTDTDWQRWKDFIGERLEATFVAYEFGTGAGWQSRINWHVEHLAGLAQAIRRPLHLVVRGGHAILPTLVSAFDRLSVIETSAFMKTMNRQLASVTARGLIQWKPFPTDKDEPLDRLMDFNFNLMEMALQRSCGLA